MRNSICWVLLLCSCIWHAEELLRLFHNENEDKATNEITTEYVQFPLSITISSTILNLL